MSRILVAYGSKHGATAEIAAAIADQLGTHGHAVDCLAAGDAKDVASYDAVVLGSAVYMKRWRPAARRLLKRRRRELAARPLWLFSSGPFGEEPDWSWAEPKAVVEQADRLGAREHVVFGGRLPTDPKGLIEKSMVNDTPAEVQDLRDWDEIRAWAEQIAFQLSEQHADGSRVA